MSKTQRSLRKSTRPEDQCSIADHNTVGVPECCLMPALSNPAAIALRPY